MHNSITDLQDSISQGPWPRSSGKSPAISTDDEVYSPIEKALTGAAIKCVYAFFKLR